MNNFTDIILKYHSSEMTNAESEEFLRNLSLNEPMRKEFEFQEKIDELMKQSLLLEAIESDPYLIKAEILARKDIATYLNKPPISEDGVRKAKKDFNLYDEEPEVESQKKIAHAEVEMALSGIDDISEVWVRNFEEKKSAMVDDITANRITEYVKKSDPFNETIIQMPSALQRINRKIVFMVAAAMLVFSLLLFKALTPSFNGNSIYKEYYEPLESNSYRLRGNSNEAAGKLQEGVDYYLSKNYTKAELVFNELRKMDTNLPEVLLFSGLNNMGQGNFAAAISTFKELLSADDQYVPEAQWYLGLCYIKAGENQKAHSLMEILSRTEGIYKKKAQLILENFNR